MISFPFSSREVPTVVPQLVGSVPSYREMGQIDWLLIPLQRSFMVSSVGSIGDGPPGAAPCRYEISRVEYVQQIRDEPALAIKTQLNILAMATVEVQELT